MTIWINETTTTTWNKIHTFLSNNPIDCHSTYRLQSQASSTFKFKQISRQNKNNNNNRNIATNNTSHTLKTTMNFSALAAMALF